MNWFTYVWFVVKDKVGGLFSSNKDKAPFEDASCEIDIEIYVANGGFIVHVRKEDEEVNYVATTREEVLAIMFRVTEHLNLVETQD